MAATSNPEESVSFTREGGIEAAGNIQTVGAMGPKTALSIGLMETAGIAESPVYPARVE
jgi:hypothetical protein